MFVGTVIFRDGELGNALWSDRWEWRHEGMTPTVKYAKQTKRESQPILDLTNLELFHKSNGIKIQPAIFFFLTYFHSS